MNILKSFSLILLILSSTNIAFATNNLADQKKEERLGRSIDNAAHTFKSDPKFFTIVPFLQAVANYANFLHGVDRHGNVKGSDKHRECTKAIMRAKDLYRGALDDVDPKKSIRTRSGETANFDVVWINGTHVYVFDFKFGGASSSPFQQDKYQKALEEKYPNSTIHRLIEIHPTNSK